MPRILIVEDDEVVRNIFSRFLASQGHEITCAFNGREGLRILESERPDLVITDIMMPETDGLEVVMAIRKMPEQIPVIAVSGGMHAMTTDFLLVAKKFGAKKVLYKPVELQELLAAVNETLAEVSAGG